MKSKPSWSPGHLLLIIMPVLGEVAKLAPNEPEKKRSVLLLHYGSQPSLKSLDPKLKDAKFMPVGFRDSRDH